MTDIESVQQAITMYYRLGTPLWRSSRPRQQHDEVQVQIVIRIKRSKRWNVFLSGKQLRAGFRRRVLLLLLLLRFLLPYLLLPLPDLFLQLLELLDLFVRQNLSDLCPDPRLHLYLLGPCRGKLLRQPVHFGLVELLAHKRAVQRKLRLPDPPPCRPDFVVMALVDLPDLRLLLRFNVYLAHYLLPDPLLRVGIRIWPAGLRTTTLLIAPLRILSCSRRLWALNPGRVYPFGLARSLHGVPLPVLSERNCRDHGQGYTQQYRA
jgi:hypothetical protein